VLLKGWCYGFMHCVQYYVCSHIQDDVSTWMWFIHLEDQGSTFFQNGGSKLIILHSVITHKTITCFGLVAYKDALVMNVCGQVVSLLFYCTLDIVQLQQFITGFWVQLHLKQGLHLGGGFLFESQSSITGHAIKPGQLIISLVLHPTKKYSNTSVRIKFI
jgi:hypothetical protein